MESPSSEGLSFFVFKASVMLICAGIGPRAPRALVFWEISHVAQALDMQTCDGI
jgi:hypothetical protein